MKTLDKKTHSSNGPSSPLLKLLLFLNTFFILYLFFSQIHLDSKADKIVSSRSNPEIEAENFSEEENPSSSSKAMAPRNGFVLNEFPLETITANLSRPRGPQRFITLSIVLVMETQAKNPLEETFNKLSDLRDYIISTLNKLSPQEALKLEGREVLKNTLKENINQKLKDDQVKELLFTTFKVS